jgi:predicted Zn finger-like uncharacterized protein
MRTFRCGECQTLHKFDESKINSPRFAVKCSKCGARNIVIIGVNLLAQSAEKNEQFLLRLGEHVIGRKSDNAQANLLVDDDYVSRKHATLQIEEREGKLFISIQDLKSTNGTFDKHKKRIKPNLKYPFLIDDYFIIGLTKLSIKP